MGSRYLCMLIWRQRRHRRRKWAGLDNLDDIVLVEYSRRFVLNNRWGVRGALLDGRRIVVVDWPGVRQLVNWRA